MALTNPRVEIGVEEKTGTWLTDGMPMIYLPRHFFIQNQSVLAEALGERQYKEAVASSGYRSAHEWCTRFEATGQATGFDVFRTYLSRISARGWGRFTVVSLDENIGSVEVSLEHSIFVEHARAGGERRSCDFFSSWISGSMDWAAESLSKKWRVKCHEHQCALDGFDRCSFRAEPL